MRVSPLAVAALLALPCVAAADTRLSLPMQPAMGPAVATGPDGRGLAAWFSCATPGTWYLCTLQAATLQGVRWGPTQNLAAPELFIPEEGPATAIGGRGVAAVAWNVNPSGAPGARVRVAVRSAGLWLAPHEIDLPDEAGTAPAVGVDGRGDVLVVWRTARLRGGSYDPSDRVRAVVWRPVTGWTQPVTLGPTGLAPGAPSVALSATGRLRAAWTLQGPPRVAVVSTDAHGAPGPVRLLPAPGTQGDVTVGPAGDLAVTWTRCHGGGSSVACAGVFVSRAAPGAHRMGPVRRVGRPGGDRRLAPRAWVSGDGTTLVSWNVTRASWVAAGRGGDFGPVRSPVGSTGPVSVTPGAGGSVMVGWSDRAGVHATITDTAAAAPRARLVGRVGVNPAEVATGAARPGGGFVLAWQIASTEVSGDVEAHAATVRGPG
ncbi:MAG: hypothetical protein U0Y82_12920 [Thermoleophilia bacterium]